MTNAEKIKIIDSKIAQIERNLFDNQLNLEMYEAYKEKKTVIEGVKANISKIEIGLKVLKDKRAKLNKEV